MRDDDLTAGRHVQADPLGLVDGASVYNQLRSNPMRYLGPRGGWRRLGGAAVGRFSNASFQFARGMIAYGGDLQTTHRSIVLRHVVLSAAFGADGLSPVAAAKTGFSISGVKGATSSAAGVWTIKLYPKCLVWLTSTRVGDECTCKKPDDLEVWQKGFVGFVNT